jgi:hypothetical protein
MSTLHMPRLHHVRTGPSFMVPADVTPPCYHAPLDVSGYVVTLTCRCRRVRDIATYEGASRLSEAVAMKHEVLSALMPLDAYAENMVRVDVVYRNGDRGVQ